MFVIAGNPDNKHYVHAMYVANYLESKLPNFIYITIPKLGKDWTVFLTNLNTENEWFYTEGPVIWKELISGGKKYRIGGLSEFWEYCYDYYGLVSFVPETELQSLIGENLSMYYESKKIFANKPGRRVISIAGASKGITEYLLHEMLQLKALFPQEGVEIRLYDDKMNDASIKQDIYDTALNINRMGIFGEKPFVKPVRSLEAAIVECDLLIILLDFKTTRILDEQHEEFFHVVLEAERFADALNKWAKRVIRVIVFNYRCPNCLFANFLIEHATAIKVKNVVVPTSFIGLKYLGLIARNSDVHVSDLSAPPVWGVHKIEIYVDVRSTIYKGYVCMPNARSIESSEDSTLPLGTVKSELRYLSHLIRSENDIERELAQLAFRKKKLLKTPTVLSKVRCVMDVLRIWYEHDCESIISLGVGSNGTFGLPRGVVISQPVSLNSNGFFVPCKEYPVPDRTLERIQKIGILVKDVLEKHKSDLCETKRMEIENKKRSEEIPRETVLI